MYILNIPSTTRNLTLNKRRDCIFEKYYKQIGFVKESSYYSMKRLNDKEHKIKITKSQNQ